MLYFFGNKSLKKTTSGTGHIFYNENNIVASAFDLMVINLKYPYKLHMKQLFMSVIIT